MALVVPSQGQRLAARVYATQAAAVRRALGGAVDRYWDDIDWDEDDEDDDIAEDFADEVAPISLAAQRSLVSTLGGYLSVVTRAPFRALNLDEVTGDALYPDEGLRDTWRIPVFSMWAALGAGVAFADAREEARRGAERQAQSDLAFAQAQGMARLTEGNPEVLGYQRVLAGDGCTFCVELADEVYGTGELMPLHPGCNCSVEPVLSGGRDGR
jgi:hypothetical protein